MKGLILSGGRGTRLRPITYTSAKQLIPVANRPILYYGLEAIRASGIRDVGIVVGETHAEIKAAVGDGRRFGVKVTYLHQPEPLGLAHAVLVAEKFLAEKPFVMYLGDNLIKSGIQPLVQEFRLKKPNAMILLAHVPNPSHFGVAELKNGRVVRLTEKPKRPKTDLALVGVYMFDRHVFQAAKAIRPSFRGELEITDAIQWLVDRGYRVVPHVVEGWWKDTGRVEDILEANRMVLDTLESRIQGRVDKKSRVQFKVVIEKGARVVRSVIRGPAIIGEGSLIQDSYIGPFTSIDRGCRIERAEIEHSIVLAQSTLRDIPQRIEDSLIGRDVVISRSGGRPSVLRFMVGDASRVELA
ncbi:MAG: glucose-1-phosphate thymidylyltransferase [Deltaproteobacteria bacterium RBG_13_61_14]|nr:MAG: glucose-1-phosphate thymidylyltransferase [Deltaproteobacteria bacterium RBG_13_61_14]